MYTLHGHDEVVNTVNFNSQGDQFMSGGNDKQVIIWKTNFDQPEKKNKKMKRKMNHMTKLEQRIQTDVGCPMGEPGRIQVFKVPIS